MKFGAYLTGMKSLLHLFHRGEVYPVKPVRFFCLTGADLTGINSINLVKSINQINPSAAESHGKQNEYGLSSLILATCRGVARRAKTEAVFHPPSVFCRRQHPTHNLQILELYFPIIRKIFTHPFTALWLSFLPFKMK